MFFLKNISKQTYLKNKKNKTKIKQKINLRQKNYLEIKKHTKENKAQKKLLSL
jgi:hypothetical protein